MEQPFQQKKKTIFAQSCEIYWKKPPDNYGEEKS